MFSDSNKVLIRADANPRIGTGHVMRMFALAQALQTNHCDVTFVCGTLPQGLVQRIKSAGFAIYTIQNDKADGSDAKDTLEIAAISNPEWIVLDGYDFDDQYQTAIKRSGAKLLVMDDYCHGSHSAADLVVNQNAYAHKHDYQSSQVLSGPKYVLLRDEFLNLPASTHAPVAAEARRILVTFGGADPDNWTLKTLQVLADLNRKNLVVDCVVGACYQHVRELEQFKKTANFTLRCHRNVDRMSTLMGRADLAISAGGTTCYELALSGVPTIVTAIVDNQLPVAEAMNEFGVMESIDREPGHDSSLSQPQRIKRLTKLIRGLLTNSKRRQQMKNLGQQLVDGNGAQRITRKMMAMQYRLRKASLDDAQLILDWRNDPEVRAVSFQSEIIPLASHKQWMQRRLEDGRTRILIAEDEHNSPVGQIRFDISDDESTALISIVVDQANRGRGVGRLLIDDATELLFDSSNVQTVIAQIKPGNTASERAFRATGYQAMAPVIVNGKVASQFFRDRSGQTANSYASKRKSA